MPLEWKHWQGQTINEKFELGEYLGESEDSAVFLTSVASPRAAIKWIAIASRKSDANRVDRQLSRWASAEELSHPHLIRLFEAGQCAVEGNPFLYVVMEYAEENLSAILPTRALTPAETQEMLDPVVEALAYIHGKGFVHGHIKPSNIMAVAEKVKISCDGITPEGQADDRSASQRSYLPPEASSGGLAPSADVWSLGITLVEVLTQRAPAFRSDAEKEDVVSMLPFPFRNIVAQCLRTDPLQRCTIADIQNHLHSPASASIPIASVPPAPHKRRSLVGPSVTAVLLATILGGVFLFKHRSAEHQAPEASTQMQLGSQPSSAAEPAVAASAVHESAAPVSVTHGAVAHGTVLRRVLPDVSNNALRTIHGTVKVKVKVYVDQDGNLERARFESAGPSRYFASKSMDAAKQWRFAPAVSGGKAAPSEWDLEFRFNKTSRQVRETVR